MSDSLGDILNKRQYNEPPEVRMIKKFVNNIVGSEPSVSIRSDSYIIVVSSAAAAGTLRFQTRNLQAELRTQKRIIIRIG
jgi:hypothetical protein